MMERSRISGPTPDPSLSEFDEPLDGAPAAAIAAVNSDVEPHAAADELKRKTAVSILWTIVRTGSDYILSFVVFAVLARKLGPASFGVYALAVAFAEVGKVLPSSGLIDTLTRAKRVSPEMADTV